jgi:hypothetical protein
MRAFLILAALATAAVAADDKKPAEPVKKDEKMKKHDLKVEFSVPGGAYKATITEVRQVGKELWAKVEVKSEGFGTDAITNTTATASFEGPDLPVKYAVFGKEWGWKNEEKDIIFVKDLDKDAKEKLEKEWKDGKVVFEAKKKDK